MKRTKHQAQKSKMLKLLYAGKPDRPYNAEFVAQILEGERQISEGKYVTLEPGSSIWELLNGTR